MVAPNNPGDESPAGSRPVPDPTSLTTAQLDRAVSSLEKLVFQRLIDNEKLYDERFRNQEALRLEQKGDTKTGVDAALSAAEKAVRENNAAFTTATNKSEKAFADQLSQLTVTYNTGINALEGKIDDIKERVSRIESIKQGGKDQLTSLYALAGFLVAAVVLVNILAANGVFTKG